MDADGSAKTPVEGVYVALLRGINVGGRNILPMPELRALAEGAGCRAVRSYIQSGNLVFRAGAGLAPRLPELISGRITERFGFASPVILRSAAEMAAVAGANPFVAAGAEAKTLHVMFLTDEPDPDAVAGLESGRSPPDAFVVRGREVYVCCPNGVARTKLTNAYFDRALATQSTARNWRTVLKLVEMSRDESR